MLVQRLYYNRRTGASSEKDHICPSKLRRPLMLIVCLQGTILSREPAFSVLPLPSRVRRYGVRPVILRLTPHVLS